MAIGLLWEVPGMSQDQYDAGVAAGAGQAEPGLLVHMAGPMEGGWRVIDLWETRADFDRFFEEKLNPALGGQAPVPVEFPIHRFQL